MSILTKRRVELRLQAQIDVLKSNIRGYHQIKAIEKRQQALQELKTINFKDIIALLKKHKLEKQFGTYKRTNETES